ncbi:MAG: fumarate hydratase [Candidatus Hadarchaeales archaeon]
MNFVLENGIAVEVRSGSGVERGFRSFLRNYRPERGNVFASREFSVERIGSTEVATVPFFFILKLIFLPFGEIYLRGMVKEAGFREKIVEMIRRAETSLPLDVVRKLRRCMKAEKSKIGRMQLQMMLENLQLAGRKSAPICQDTGVFTFFVKGWRKLPFDVEASIKRAVEEATEKIPLRRNLVDPLSRKTVVAASAGWQPAVHLIGSGDGEVEVELLVKGAGTENYTKLFMLRPTASEDEILRTVLEVLEAAGGKICPPVIVGVGIGGSPENAILLSKIALLRPLGRRSRDGAVAEMERRIEVAAGKLGIGPMGLGGKCTVLEVHVEKAPCHTAALPVGVSFQCWVARRAVARVKGGKMEVVEP